MSASEEMAVRTTELETSMYALLDSCDAYRETVERLLTEENAAAEPREQLTHRLEQLSTRITRITQIVEDDALSILLFMVDRLFAIERAEQGIDI